MYGKQESRTRVKSNFTSFVKIDYYSGVRNKRGGVRIIGGLEMVQYNSNRGVGIIGGGVLEK